MGDKHGARESIGSCLDIQQSLHFLDQFSIVQGQSPIFIIQHHRCPGEQ